MTMTTVVAVGAIMAIVFVLIVIAAVDADGRSYNWLPLVLLRLRSNTVTLLDSSYSC
jgi:hypothetical protein